MAANPHRYSSSLVWTGNRGTGTSNYRAYERSYDLRVEGKPTLTGSSDPSFYGDREKWNPEEMLLGALSSCHMLSYLHVCAEAGITVLEYSDAAEAEMLLEAGGSGHFTRVVLRPRVCIAEDRAEQAQALHHLAHEKCFIANSVNFPVLCESTIETHAADTLVLQ